MEGVLTVIGRILGSGYTLFLSVFLLNLAAFYFTGQIIRVLRVMGKRWIFILYALVNTGLIYYLQQYSGGYTNLFIISLITAVMIPEMVLVGREKAWTYLGIYWLLALSLQCSYLFSCALINLGQIEVWERGSIGHRFAIFNLTMLITAAFFVITSNLSKNPWTILADLLKERRRSQLLIAYMGISTAALAISGHLISKLLYSEMPRYIEVSMYQDILLKNALIMGNGFLIVIYQIRQEQSSRQNIILAKDLETERGFRANLYSDALFSYCANVTKDRFVEGFGNFTLNTEGSYREAIIEFLLDTAHPQDLDALSEVMSPEYYEMRLKGDPTYGFRMRMAAKALEAIPEIRQQEELMERIKSGQEWIWMEFELTVVKDSATEDILLYVSLNSVDEEMTEKERLTRAANTDPLTGLLNRSGMEEILEECLGQNGTSGALFMIDMDHFKSVNDLLGHPMGDKALQDIAETLEQIFRGGDSIGRLGGDEFCVFASGLTDEELISKRAVQLGKGGTRTYSSPDGVHNVTVTLSIGIAICHQEEAITYKELYARADVALYEAKTAGRNTYRIAK